MNFKKLGTLLLLNLAALPNAFALDTPATPISQEALFVRCYYHLTQKRANPSDALYIKVKNSEIMAVDACMQILNGVSLYSTGVDEGKLKIINDVNKDVLSNFFQFHRTWFASQDIGKNLPGQDNGGANVFNDQYEHSHFLSYALFTDGAKYDSVFKLNSALEALRTLGYDPYPHDYTGYVSNLETAYAGAKEPVKVTIPQKGELVGIRKITSQKDSAEQSLGIPRIDQFINLAYNGPSFNIYDRLDGKTYFHRQVGDGLMGKKSYILHNIGRESGEASDGGTLMPRRWSQAIMKDLLCRSLPMIRITDALPEVQSTNLTGDTPAFRTSSTCMQCHATIDPLAATIRQVARGGYHLRVFTQTKPAEVDAFVNKDNFYYRRPPTGKIFIRGYDGILHDEVVNNASEASHYLASIEDPYICAASRYYNFFTGVEVPLKDSGDPDSTALSAAEKAYYDEVVALGKQFFIHKDVKKLIHEIMKLKTYQNNSMRIPKT